MMSGFRALDEPTEDDECTNECDDTKATHWCGRLKEDSKGAVFRCQERTSSGDTCRTGCGHERGKSSWVTLCLTGSGSRDYCSGLGRTIYKRACTTKCWRHSQGDYWCQTGKEIIIGIEVVGTYRCSPRGLVKPLELSIAGSRCVTECGNSGGTAYSWCYTQHSWDYCSPAPSLTRYGASC